MNLGEKAAVQDDPASFVQTLLGWYDRARRELPWRAAPGEDADPYAVWLSEIMLQQTTVKAVAPYYVDFLKRWPTVQHLADAPLDEVLSAWAGLGYYARARNLHACANAIASLNGGRFPDIEQELLKLPGIGAYTAAAIAAIAFGRKAAVVDGNVERVLSRYFAIETPLPRSKKTLREIAERLAPDRRSGDFAQGMMDLGATICTSRNPSCAICPLEAGCAGRARGLAHELPYREKTAAKPTRRGSAFFVLRADDAILLRKRPLKGLLGGMTEVPGTPWVAETGGAGTNPYDHAPVVGAWQEMPGQVRHTFTHFHLELSVIGARVGEEVVLNETARPGDCRWVLPRDIEAQALPSVMRKVLDHALSHLSA